MRIRDKIRVFKKEEAQNSNIEDITDNLKERYRLSFIYKPSVPYKVWEKFIEKSGKTIEQIKQDFGDVEIIIEEDPISPGMYVQCFLFFYFDNLFSFYYYVLVLNFITTTFCV